MSCSILRPLVLCSVLTALGPAKANAEDARTLLEQGIKAFGLAQLPASRQLLQQARAATSEPKVLARIHLYLGLVAAVEGTIDQARKELTRALGYDPSLTLDADTFKKELVELFDSVRGELRGKLSVIVTPPRARVIIDGKEHGAAPLKTELQIGKHTVQVKSADGRASYRAEVEIGPLTQARVAARLEPLQGRISVRTSPSGAAVRIDGKPIGRTPIEHGVEVGHHLVQIALEGHEQRVQRVEVEPDVTAVVRVRLERSSRPEAAQPTHRSPFGDRLWTWITAGAALAALGTGIGLGVSSNSDFASWESNCWNNLHPECDEVADRVRAKDRVANVLFGVAGALAVSSLVIYFVEGRAESQSATLSALKLPGGALTIPF